MMNQDDPVGLASPRSRRGDALISQVSDETFDFREIRFDDRKITGAQIAGAFGAHPVEDFVVLAQLESLELETLRPTETVDLSNALRFFVIKGDGTNRFVVDGLNLEWPLSKVTGLTIKRLIEKDDVSVELLLEREDQPDKVIEDEEEVRLGDAGVEKLHTRKVGVTIIVEGTPHRWLKKTISYAEVVTLEVSDYPQHPEITYSVKYKNGPGNKPEGTLAKGESVKVKDRMIFNVSETGQS